MTTTELGKSIAYDRVTKDYAMTYEGQLIGYASNYHEAENRLNEYVFDLLTTAAIDPDAFAAQQELDEADRLDQIKAEREMADHIDDPLPDPGPEGPSVPGDERPRCRNCGKAHHTQRCPAIRAALFAPAHCPHCGDPLDWAGPGLCQACREWEEPGFRIAA